jgi:hypothetical protein
LFVQFKDTSFEYAEKHTEVLQVPPFNEPVDNSLLRSNKTEKAQNKTSEFCSRTDSFNNGSGVTTLDRREMSLPIRSFITVDAKPHGSIEIRGGERSDILVRACVQTWGISDEAARSLARDIHIKTGSVIQAESGVGTSGNEDVWSVSTVSYEILVPRATNLNLSAGNGNISIYDVEGKLELVALDGNLILKNLAGDVHARTINGGVFAALSGERWMGSQLDVETINGNIDLNIPENYAANLEIKTETGTLQSNVSSLQSEKRHLGIWLNTAFNGGGAPVRINTTNGNVRINGFSKSQ